jgi:predicted ATP-binding protein involved in virulence
MASQWTPGIVLIDEVDMHLHPEWQQVVLQALMEAFPRMQFVVTTHSPQVLTTVKSENIRVLAHGEALEPQCEIKGIDSAVALNDIMGVNPVPQQVEEAQWQADYIAKIESGIHDDQEGRYLRSKLISFYGARHPVMLDADRLIRFQAFKLRNQAKHRD